MICNAWEYQGIKYCLPLHGWSALAFQQFQQVYMLKTNSQHEIHMILGAKFITKENSRGFSNILKFLHSFRGFCWSPLCLQLFAWLFIPYSAHQALKNDFVFRICHFTTFLNFYKL